MQPDRVQEVLADRAAMDLLAGRIPARLAYGGRDGTPRVLPIWFHWSGTELVVCSGPDAPKTRALRRRPAVAITIDSERPPYRSLQIRGTAVIELVEGVAPEYRWAAERYYGAAVGRRWVERIGGVWPRTARISIKPEWARLVDLGRHFPGFFDDLPAAIRERS